MSYDVVELIRGLIYIGIAVGFGIGVLMLDNDKKITKKRIEPKLEITIKNNVRDTTYVYEFD
jgi:hypothetical protein